MRRLFRYYAQLSPPQQREAGILLLIIALLSFLLTDTMDGFYPRLSPDTLATDSLITVLESKEKEGKKRDSLFFFDPNHAEVSTFIALGIPSTLAQRIARFREKGGRFYKPSDFKKIYGLRTATYEKLLPFIRISSGKPVAKAKDTLSVFLNSVDSVGLMKIPGMRAFIARRILRYRAILGGYCARAQLLEVYGLDSNNYAKISPHIKIAPHSWQTIHINTADYAALRHPYIRSELRKEILNYRRKVGTFKAVEELLACEAMDSLLFKKLAPYLAL